MAQYKLPADANRILFVRHLPDAITHDELYELFGKFGAVEQIRLYAYQDRQSDIKLGEINASQISDFNLDIH